MKTLNKMLNSVTGLLILTIVLVIISNLYPDVSKISSDIFFIVLSLASLFLAPILIIKYVFKDRVQNFGFRIPKNKKKAILLTLAAFLVITPLLFYLSNNSDFQNYYINKINKRGLSSNNFFLLVCFLSSFYFLAEEFLFRGFLFFSLLKKVGLHSFWIISLLFAVLHITKPLPEIIAAFFISIIFCYLSYKTKSFIPAFIAHLAIAVFTNSLFVFF